MSMSWSMVGPVATLRDLLKVRMPRTHALRGLAGALPQDDGDDVEEDQHRRLVEAAHREDAPTACVVGHCLCANVDDGVRSSRNLARGLVGHSDCPRASRMRPSLQRLHSREIARACADHEQVAGAKRRRSHVADHVGIHPKVHEPHAEGAHHQAFPPDPVAGDPVGLQQLVTEYVDLSGGARVEHRADLVERAREETVDAGRHSAALPAPARSCRRFAAASPPSNTALPATIRSTPMAAMDPTFSRVTPPSTPSITVRPLRSISSRAAARRRSVEGAKRWPPQPGLTARTSTSSRSSRSGSTAVTGVPEFNAIPRLTAGPSACRTRCGCRAASTWKVSMSAPAST